ncbi:hypothetical protein H8959_018618 [Pygathrix nigripes]
MDGAGDVRPSCGSWRLDEGHSDDRQGHLLPLSERRRLGLLFSGGSCQAGARVCQPLGTELTVAETLNPSHMGSQGPWRQRVLAAVGDMGRAAALVKLSGVLGTRRVRSDWQPCMTVDPHGAPCPPFFPWDPLLWESLLPGSSRVSRGLLPILERGQLTRRLTQSPGASTPEAMAVFSWLWSLHEVSKSDLGRKIKEGVEEAAKTAKQSAESVSKGGEKLGRTAAFRALSQGVESVKKEIDDSVLGQTGPYRRPQRLRKRTEFAGEKFKEEKVFEPNEEALGVVLHKDSKWYQQWKDFKENNVVFNRFFEMKMKYDESDNAFIRASRALTDKVTDLLGGLFSKTEMSEVLTEILRVDPAFDKDRFLKQCENDIIPNVLEAMISGELDILKDWCYEATYSQLAYPIQQAKALGLQFHSRILDIDNIDLAMGKMMEPGPVLIITFQAQLVMVVRNPKGEVVEGDPDKVLRMLYVWALCRDQDELNPYAAWRLLDISASSTEQIL